MTYESLAAQQHEVNKQLQEIEAQLDELRAKDRQAVIEQIRNQMLEHGLTLADLGRIGVRLSARAPGRSDRLRAKAPIKYRHPLTGDTWSGRGLQPKWLQRELTGGGKLEDFKVS